MHKLTLFRVLPCIVALVACVPSAKPQHCGSLVGTWKLNLAQSMLGTQRPPESQAEAEILTMALTDATLQQSFNYQGSLINGEASYSFSIDDKDHKIANPNQNPFFPAEVKAHWQACTLIAETVTSYYGFSFKTSSEYYVSADDLQLIVHQISKTSISESERRLVFERLK